MGEPKLTLTRCLSCRVKSRVPQLQRRTIGRGLVVIIIEDIVQPRGLGRRRMLTLRLHGGHDVVVL